MCITPVINVYCDESCHLENDGEKAMVLGAVWCPQPTAKQLNKNIAHLKSKFHLSRFFEIKWGKVSASKIEFYKELLDLFFTCDELNFRGWVVPDKTVLRHGDFVQTHDDWYYKMYFNMLKTVIQPGSAYHIYLDIKDTRSKYKLRKLQEYLANANYDFQREIVAKTQHVHSHDINLLQLADLIIGAIAYTARGLDTSPAKMQLIELIRGYSGLSLKRNTLPTARKFNLCFWQPQGRGTYGS